MGGGADDHLRFKSVSLGKQFQGAREMSSASDILNVRYPRNVTQAVLFVCFKFNVLDQSQCKSTYGWPL